MADLTNFRQVYDELTEAVVSARHQFFSEHLRSWYEHLAETPAVAAIIARLESGLDVDAFLNESEKSQGSFIGSGTLQWPADKAQRLGMKLGVFRRMAEDKLDATEFSYSYTYVENNFDVNIHALTEQIFAPFARDLRRYLESELSKVSAVPASDRIVRIDHNSSAYREAMEALSALEMTLRGLNDYDDPEEKEQIVAEISAAQRLLQAVRVRTEAIAALLEKPLKYITKKFVDVGLSKLAGVVIGKLAALIGWTIS